MYMLVQGAGQHGIDVLLNYSIIVESLSRDFKVMRVRVLDIAGYPRLFDCLSNFSMLVRHLAFIHNGPRKLLFQPVG